MTTTTTTTTTTRLHGRGRPHAVLQQTCKSSNASCSWPPSSPERPSASAAEGPAESVACACQPTSPRGTSGTPQRTCKRSVSHQ
eukprot:4037144-Pyramimonas_sp.AAC.1